MTRPPTFAPTLTLLAAALIVAAAAPARAITLGVPDTFQTPPGEVHNWMGANIGLLSNVANGGPGGAGDHALDVNSGNKFAVINISQWSGNYTAVGVGRIGLDVRNLSTFDLKLRLGIVGAGGAGPEGSGDTYVTNYAITVPNNGSWHSIEFPARAADFAPGINNSMPVPSAAAALANVTQFRILHNPTPNDFRGADVSGVNGPGLMRLDNIVALAGENPEDADFDDDLDVDGADFLTWQRGLGVGTTHASGDADGNEVVDGLDLAIWKGQYSGAAVAAAAAVPEPGGPALAGIAALSMLVGGRRLHVFSM